MSYGIIRVQKITSGGVAGIQIHDMRLKQNISHTNKDIDWSKAPLNYNLKKPPEEKSFYRAMKERTKELNLKKAVRKDAIVMAQCLVTSDDKFFNNLSPKQQEKFFLESHDFLVERYGKENVISSTVHLDEKTPHMHFNFVPVTSDGRLSAKSLFTPTSLRELQNSFFSNVAESHGLLRGQVGSKSTHLDVVDYKLQKRQEEHENIKGSINALEDKKNLLEIKLDGLDNELYTIQEESFSKLMIKRNKDLKKKIENLTGFIYSKGFTDWDILKYERQNQATTESLSLVKQELSENKILPSL